MTGVNLFLIFRVNLLVPLVTPSVLESVWQSNGSALTQETFESFREQFRRSYEMHSDEYNRRKLYFENTIKRHAHLNSFSTDKDSAKYGINQFSDLSLNEFRERHATATAEAVPEYPGLKTNGLPVPAKFDWRDKGAVGPVQDQQACGSCWAFSVVGAVQAVHAMAGLPVEQLSVQQVVDCSYRDQGCNGGSTTKALAWMKQTRVKLVQQSDYPYKAESGLCHFFSASHDGVSVKDFAAYDFSGREEAMMGRLVEWGPLAVTVDSISWQDYLGGIIQHHCSSHHANHAVLIVGYDTMGAVPYWIVQNSWGTSWGNKGYVYIKMGEDVCGVADSVAAVLL